MSEFCQSQDIDVFAKHVSMDWVAEAVQQTGRASLRTCRFPAEQAVWLVLGIGLMRNRSIQQVCDTLSMAFPDAKGELPPLATSSIIKAKEKLGSEPMRYLFKTTAAQWETQCEFDEIAGLKLLSVDGTYFKTHNTEENHHFGFAQSTASFPSVLAVTLMSTRSHLLSDAAFGPVTHSEIHYAQQLVGSAPEHSLTLFDRGFMSADLLKVYWQRWEIERGYGELKQYQLENKPVLRSKKKDGVYQELWGILTTYNIVRLEMAAMAVQHKVEPQRISFINALFLIQDEFGWSDRGSPGAIPQHLKLLRENGKRLILPPKRKRPSYPRVVLKKTVKYPSKNATRS